MPIKKQQSLKDVSEAPPDLSFLDGKKIKPSIDINDPEDKTWLKEFKTYLRVFFTSLLEETDLMSEEDKEDAIDSLLNGEDRKNLKYFVYGVTHKTYHPDKEKNYETYEIVGDKFLYSSFVLYLRTRYPGISESVITNIFQKVLGKKYQAQICSYMGLDSWAIFPFSKKYGMIKPDMSFREDLFEAFIGVIVIILEKEKKLKYALDIFDTFMKCLFKKRNFKISEEDKEAYLSNKTYVQQYFTVVAKLPVVGSILEREEEFLDKNGHTVFRITVYQSKQVLDKIYDLYGIKIKDEIFGVGENRSKKEATNIAYGQARERLIEYGLTADLKGKVEKQKTLGDDYEELLDKAKEIDEDVVDVEISHFSNLNYTVININGILKNDRKIKLYSKMFENNVNGQRINFVQETKNKFLSAKIV